MIKLDAVGATAYSYTEFGALLSEDGPWADDTVSYSYTSNRLRSQLTLVQPNATAWSQDYTYDSSSRLTGITSPAGAFAYTYDPINNMQVRKLALPNGGYITNGFDAMGRLTSTTLKNSGHGILNQHSYLYDDGSRRTRQTRVGTLSTASVTNFLDYGYDKIGQLQSALGKESGGTTNRWHERFYYGYDKAGNLHPVRYGAHIPLCLRASQQQRRQSLHWLHPRLARAIPTAPKRRGDLDAKPIALGPHILRSLPSPTGRHEAGKVFKVGMGQTVSQKPPEKLSHGVNNRVQNVQTNVFNVDSRNQLTSVVRTNSSATVAGTTALTRKNHSGLNEGAGSASDRL